MSAVVSVSVLVDVSVLGDVVPVSLDEVDALVVDASVVDVDVPAALFVVPVSPLHADNKIDMTLSSYRFLVVVFVTAFVHNAVYFTVFTMGSTIGFLGAIFGLGLASALFTSTVAILPMLVASRRRASA